ncbi:STAS domain-containing protein [Nonomuraea polychroma]|uniref:STAS domain-containing protein n=1 Tax=Nonomuraea polychroma TaxID=46176 RepID=UPI003D8DAC75
MTPLSLQGGPTATGVLISVGGEVDATNADRLESYVGQMCRRGDPVVLDLSELSFMDSSGMNVLLRLDAAAREQGSALHLAAVGRAPARLLELTGVVRALRVHPSVDEALACLAASRSAPPGDLA